MIILVFFGLMENLFFSVEGYIFYEVKIFCILRNGI